MLHFATYLQQGCCKEFKWNCICDLLADLVINFVILCTTPFTNIYTVATITHKVKPLLQFKF